MAFNISGGLSSAATSLGDTAKEANIAADKWDLEKQKIALVDQLQTKHEQAGFAQQTSERVATQEFTGGENTKNRQNSLDIAKLTTDATIKAAGIGAGATFASAQMHVNMMQKQMDQNAPLIAAQIKQVGASTEEQIAKTAMQVVQTSNAQEKESAQKELAEAGQSNDPDRIAKAQQRFAVANANSSEMAALATSTASLAKIAKDEMDKVQVAMSNMQNPMNQTPEGQARLKAQYDAAKTLYDQRMAAAIRASEAVPPLPSPGAAGGIIKYDAAGNRVGAAAPAAPPVTGTPAPTSMPMPSPGATGLINGGPM